MEKPVRLTLHAEANVLKRGLSMDWVIAAIRTPDRVADDRRGAGYTRRFLALHDAGNRCPRVVCFEDADEIRVLTTFLDRGERRRR